MTDFPRKSRLFAESVRLSGSPDMGQNAIVDAPSSLCLGWREPSFVAQHHAGPAGLQQFGAERVGRGARRRRRPNAIVGAVVAVAEIPPDDHRFDAAEDGGIGASGAQVSLKRPVLVEAACYLDPPGGRERGMSDYRVFRTMGDGDVLHARR